MAGDSRVEDHSWRFVTNHAHVLECIATNPTVRLRDIAATVGITERTVSQIVSDLARTHGRTVNPVPRYRVKRRLAAGRVGARRRSEREAELPQPQPACAALRHSPLVVGGRLRAGAGEAV